MEFHHLLSNDDQGGRVVGKGNTTKNEGALDPLLLLLAPGPGAGPIAPACLSPSATADARWTNTSARQGGREGRSRKQMDEHQPVGIRCIQTSCTKY